MDKIQTYIINYNRLTFPLLMVDFLSKNPELEIIFIDNSSTYPPLLSWYESQNKFEVIKSHRNRGNCVFWRNRIIDRASIPFIVTDPDLDLSNVPLDFLDVLKEGLCRYPDKSKCGFGLEIDDFPDDKNDYQKRAVEIEKSLRGEFDGIYYYGKNAQIDTTFALYNKKSKQNFLPAIRTGKPYVARHLPYYYTKDNITEEDIYYVNSATKGCSSRAKLTYVLGIEF